MKSLSAFVFAGALLLGACSSTRTDTVATTDDFDAVQTEASVTADMTTGTAHVDSEGRVHTGTNTNLIPEPTSPSTIVAQSNIIAEAQEDLVITDTTSMTSSSQVDTTVQTTATSTTRTRMRKD